MRLCVRVDAVKRWLGSVFQIGTTRRAGAIHAAINLAILFDAVADNAALAMDALGRHGVDCTLEAVEDVFFTACNHFE